VAGDWRVLFVQRQGGPVAVLVAKKGVAEWASSTFPSAKEFINNLFDFQWRER
jgi:hypothetical protein